MRFFHIYDTFESILLCLIISVVQIKIVSYPTNKVEKSD